MSQEKQEKIPISGTYPGNSPTRAQGGAYEDIRCGIAYNSEQLGTA